MGAKTVVQTTLETMKGVRLDIPEATPIKVLELVAIRGLIDSFLAHNKPSSEVEANLYSARHHILRAIREQAVTA